MAERDETTGQAKADVLRHKRGIIGRTLLRWGMAALPTVFAILRRVRPVARFGTTYLVTRHDDVREVFADDRSFGVPYLEKLNRITGGERFILGLAGQQYRADLMSLRQVMRFSDAAALGRAVAARSSSRVEAAGGRIDVVELVRDLSFGFMAEYLGIPELPDGELARWGTRLFEYQFVADDKPLVAEVDKLAPALRAHIHDAIDQRRKNGMAHDDVLGRCLVLQGDGVEPFTDDDWITTALLGMIVGGPPQPPMVLPQAMEQLLRRPDALAAAQRAAQQDDDRGLLAILTEAMRFDPLAPWMPRTVLVPRTIGSGKHARALPKGAKVLASIASAMRDERRVFEPLRFDATRGADQYMHFGWGMHQCFGLEINRATLPQMVKPLLRKARLRRAPGRAGHLRKEGPFASSLVLEFD